MANSTTWNGGAGDWSDASKWSGGVPQSGTTAIISGANNNVALNGIALSRQSVSATGDGTSSSITLNNSAVGFASTMDFNGQGWVPELILTGADINMGIINASAGSFGAFVMQGASFANYFDLTAAPSATGTYSAMTVMDYGILQNSGEMAARANGSLNVYLDSSPAAFVNYGWIESDAGSRHLVR